MQKLAEICIRRPVFAAMIVLSLVVVGAAAYFNLGVDRFPSVDLPTVSVRTQLPGASAEEVETLVSQPIEEVVNTVDGIDELREVLGGDVRAGRRLRVRALCRGDGLANGRLQLRALRARAVLADPGVHVRRLPSRHRPGLRGHVQLLPLPRWEVRFCRLLVVHQLRCGYVFERRRDVVYFLRRRDVRGKRLPILLTMPRGKSVPGVVVCSDFVRTRLLLRGGRDGVHCLLSRADDGRIGRNVGEHVCAFV